MRVQIIANLAKDDVKPAVDRWLPWLRQRVEVLGIDGETKPDAIDDAADVVLVLGGDGTLLSVARRLRGKQTPVMGVNFGRLGFLASFTPEEFQQQFELFLAGRLITVWRQLIEASVLPAGVDCPFDDRAGIAGSARFAATALNDAVVTAGPPFRMIDLEIGTDGEGGVHYSGDGVIIATAAGSTAYNVSAGGPIINADVEAMCITPLCPHSLSFRPVVISMNSIVVIHAHRVNAGTTLFCDGQTSTPLYKNERLIIRRSPHRVQLVENPTARQWRTLAEKLHWGVGPRYNDAHGRDRSLTGE